MGEIFAVWHLGVITFLALIIIVVWVAAIELNYKLKKIIEILNTLNANTNYQRGDK